MKTVNKHTTLITFLHITCFMLMIGLSNAIAQTPDFINYQGVATNNAGNAIANQSIRLRFRIRNTTSGGTIQYSEQRTTTTDATGQFSVQIGGAGATNVTGTWAGITWATGAKFLQVEMDATGGTTFVNMGTQQLASVPYAQYSKTANALDPASKINTSQINASGATTGQVLQYNGTTWVPATPASGSGFALPYSGSNAGTTSFEVTNTNAAASTAVSGKTSSTNTASAGVRGETTVAGSTGVSGKANNATATAIKGENPSGRAIQGINNVATYPAIEGWSTATNNGVGVAGIANIGTESIGVNGTANSGTGVAGYSGSFRGISGSSISGTALYGYSAAGYGLEVAGNVKISGGNTSPGAGKVLTSDAAGNATWQPASPTPKIAFAAKGLSSSIPYNSYTVIPYSSEEYDTGNNFDMTTKRFTAPVRGIYHFDVNMKLSIISVLYSFSSVRIEVRKQSAAGSQSFLEFYESPLTTDAVSSSAIQSPSFDLLLEAGDQLYLRIYQNNTGSLSVSGSSGIRFSGHLLMLQ